MTRYEIILTIAAICVLALIGAVAQGIIEPFLLTLSAIPLMTCGMLYAETSDAVAHVFTKQSLSKDIIATPIDVYTIRMNFGFKQRVYRMDGDICSFETHAKCKHKSNIEEALRQFDKQQTRIHKILGV